MDKIKAQNFASQVLNNRTSKSEEKMQTIFWS